MMMMIMTTMMMMIIDNFYRALFSGVHKLSALYNKKVRGKKTQNNRAEHALPARAVTISLREIIIIIITIIIIIIMMLTDNLCECPRPF